MQKNFILPILPQSKFSTIVGNCGIVCIKMCIDFFKKNKNNQTLEEFIKKEKFSNKNADYLIDILQKYNLQTSVWDIRKDIMTYDFLLEKRKDFVWIEEKVLMHLNFGKPVICFFKKQGKNKQVNHVILIVGYKTNENKEILGYFFNDPDLFGENLQTNFLDKKTFLNICLGFFIFVSN